jgi:hypothetical protein
MKKRFPEELSESQRSRRLQAVIGLLDGQSTQDQFRQIFDIIYDQTVLENLFVNTVDEDAVNREHAHAYSRILEALKIPRRRYKRTSVSR